MPNSTSNQHQWRKHVIMPWSASSSRALPSGNPKLTANIINLSKGLLHFKGKYINCKMTELKFRSLNLPFSTLQAAAHATKQCACGWSWME
jgi:hypothetical protein